MNDNGEKFVNSRVLRRHKDAFMVLIDGNWHSVADGSLVILELAPGVVGFQFIERYQDRDVILDGPLSSLHAIRAEVLSFGDVTEVTDVTEGV